MEKVEAELLRLGRRVHADGHADEPERDRAAPDRVASLLSTEADLRRKHGRCFKFCGARTHTAQKRDAYVPKNSSHTRGSALEAGDFSPASALLEQGKTLVDDVDIGPALACGKRQEPRLQSGFLRPSAEDPRSAVALAALLAELARRGSRISSSRVSPSASPSMRAASSGFRCAPPLRLGHDLVDHAELRQCTASGLSATAALTFSAPSRQRIAAQPSGEITL